MEDKIIFLIAIIVGSGIGIMIGISRRKKQQPETISPGGEFLPCPKCSNNEVKRIQYTWWGGFLGPKMFNYVQCQKCYTSYNGKTGRPCTLGIAIYLSAAIVIGILLGILLVKLKFF